MDDCHPERYNVQIGDVTDHNHTYPKTRYTEDMMQVHQHSRASRIKFIGLVPGTATIHLPAALRPLNRRLIYAYCSTNFWKNLMWLLL